MKNFSAPVFGLCRKELAGDLIQGAFLALLFAWLFYDALTAFWVLTPLMWFWHRECESARKFKSDEQFRRMFREWILLLSASLSAGYSVENALLQSCRELKLLFPAGGVMIRELEGMLAQRENNQRLEVIFREFALRHPLEEIKSFVEVFAAARASGGSLNGVIRHTASQMAQIMDTRREIRTLLAAKIYEQKIMTVMPAAILLYIRLASAEFLEGLYHNPSGAAVATVCLLIYVSAYFLGKRMVQFDV